MIALRNLIRDVAKRRPKAQPDAIAAAVVRRTPDDMVYAYYEEALRPLVADILRLDRNSAITSMRQRSSNAPANSARPLSAKVAAIRAVDWDKIFCSRISTADGWKQVGDCSADELIEAAQVRRRDAERNIEMANFYEDLASRIKNAGVATARELKAKDLI